MYEWMNGVGYFFNITIDILKHECYSTMKKEKVSTVFVVVKMPASAAS